MMTLRVPWMILGWLWDFFFPSPVSCLLSLVSCLMSPVSCLVSPLSCLLSPVSSLLSCLLSSVSCILSLHSCFLARVSCLISRVYCFILEENSSRACPKLTKSWQWWKVNDRTIQPGSFMEWLNVIINTPACLYVVLGVTWSLFLK